MAAHASGTTVLMPGALYVDGNQSGFWTETTAHVPVSRKGMVRAAMEQSFRAAIREGVRVILLRAGDFSNATKLQTLLNMVMLRGLSRGPITAAGRVEVSRSYPYLPDTARAAVALAEKRADLAPVKRWTCPASPSPRAI